MLLALVLEAIALSPAGVDLADPLRRALIMGGYALALVFIIQNRRSRGMQIIGLGLVLNLAPMLLNGGLMPVTAEKLAEAGLSSRITDVHPGEAVPRTKDVLRDAGHAPLAFLGDRIVLPRGPVVHLHGLASPGDFVILAGVLVAFLSPLVALSRRAFTALARMAAREHGSPVLG